MSSSSSRFAFSLAAFYGLTYPTIGTRRKLSAARKWLSAVTRPSRLLQPHDHVDRGDPHAFGRRDLDLWQFAVWDVGQFVRVLEIEMEVRPGLGVVPDLCVVEGNLA